MSFQQGLSGLNAASKNLDVIGNNVANANTYGAKSSRAEFADLYANALNGATSSAIGIGVTVAAVTQQFTQGNITTTGSSSDLAINGSGFFQLSDGATTSYTRNGQFQVSKDGNIVTSSGLKLLGYPADTAGNIRPGATSALTLPTAGISPQQTQTMTMELNLNASSGATGPVAVATALKVKADAAATAATVAQAAADAAASAAASAAAAAPTDADLAAAASAAAAAAADAVVKAIAAAGAASAAASALTTAGAGSPVDFNDAGSYNNATSVTTYDAKGQAVALTYYFQKSATDTWNVYATANGVPVNGTATHPLPLTTVTFATDGSGPVTPTGSVTLDIPASTNAAGAQTLAINGVQLELAGATQYGSAFAVTDLAQDGFAAGQLYGLSIDSKGVVMATYSNGQSKAAGQVELATFRDPQGLKPLGGNLWAGTLTSGTPIVGTPGSGNLGVLQSGALEESNVDLTNELVNMITAQRTYQANAQTIKTEDQVLQTLVNLR